MNEGVNERTNIPYSLFTVPCSCHTVYPWAMASVTYPSYLAAVLRVGGPGDENAGIFT